MKQNFSLHPLGTFLYPEMPYKIVRISLIIRLGWVLYTNHKTIYTKSLMF